MAERHDVIIVGGGVFGASAGLALAGRGYDVALLDPGPLPHRRASSTDISKVIRMDYGADEFYMRTMERALEGWRAWNEAWPRPLYHEVGFLLLTREALSAGTFEGDSWALLKRRGHNPERLSQAEIAARFPAWAEAGFEDGYFNPQAGWAEAGAVVTRLIGLARKAGVSVRDGLRVEGLWTDAERVRGVETAAARLGAEHVVLSCGAWTPALLPQLEGKVWPVAQPVFHFQTEQPRHFQPPHFTVWAAEISRTGWYGFPALDDGTVKVANHGPGRRLPPDASQGASPEQERMFREFLSAALPALAGAPVLDSRLCFYADSWDGDFYIDRVPDYQGLTVATGGSGHAFKFAPLLGDWIADAVEGKQNPDLERFRWRSAADRRTEEARYEVGR